MIARIPYTLSFHLHVYTSLPLECVSCISDPGISRTASAALIKTLLFQSLLRGFWPVSMLRRLSGIRSGQAWDRVLYTSACVGPGSHSLLGTQFLQP